MRITDLLKEQSIDLNGHVSTKEETIHRMIALMQQNGNVIDVEEYTKRVFLRESEGTTGIGEGIAIPHAKTEAIERAGLAAMVIKEGVDYDSLDGQPVSLVFLIAAPNTKDNIHLDVLSRLSVLLMDEEFTTNLRNAKTAKEFLNIIDVTEKKKFPDEEAKEDNITTVTPNANRNGLYQVLAVTACPTGIAHTYMAAESLEKKGQEMGITIKVETNGSTGVKNALTQDEIEACDCIIIAADKNVEMDRFDGKPIIKTKVADGIHKAEQLIQDAVNGKGILYSSANSGRTEQYDNNESIGRKFYKDLMNGVSNMLPFVIGGGILIAIAFLIDDYNINPATYGSNTPIAAFIKTIGDTAFGFMLPILAGYIAYSIADRPGLAAGFIGGVLAKEGITFTTLSDGVSAGFIGALLAGFLAGYLVLALKKILSFLPNALEGIKPILLYPVLGILLTAIVVSFINPFIGTINTGLNNFLASMNGTSKILLGCILGAMMSIDMGGPFNKAAYVFGTASLASSEFEIMAAVMAGGMTAPLVIAICATIFRNRFDTKTRQSAYVNYIMGFSFITEGAIPFAAQDPIRVIPSCVLGSAITGGLSMAFGCGVRAPHGGIFVLPVITNWVGYLIAIVIGSAVGAVLLGFLKKPVE